MTPIVNFKTLRQVNRNYDRSQNHGDNSKENIKGKVSFKTLKIVEK